jgi:hypothetical protein
MMKVINTDMEWIAQPQNTVVVQIGDQVDSLTRHGELNPNEVRPSPDPSAWEKLDDTVLLRFTDKLDDLAKQKGGRFISLLGNHELMNAMGDFSYVSQYSLTKTGGYEGRVHKFRPGGEYARILAKRPVVLKLGNVLFSHAGILPDHLKVVDDNLDTYNKLATKLLLGEQPLSVLEAHVVKELFLGANSMLWNRKYLNTDGSKDLQYVLEHTQTMAMVIGHNTVQNITPLYNNHLWLTDVGLSRAISGESVQVLEILNGKTFRIVEATSA